MAEVGDGDAGHAVQVAAAFAVEEFGAAPWSKLTGSGA
jgi:hypothetical protein